MLYYRSRRTELGDGDMLNQDEKIEVGYNRNVSGTAAPSEESLLLMHEGVKFTF